MGKSQVFGGLGVVPDSGGITAEFGLGEDETDFHIHQSAPFCRQEKSRTLTQQVRQVARYSNVAKDGQFSKGFQGKKYQESCKIHDICHLAIDEDKNRMISGISTFS
jgi:hypothetical protein